MAYHLFAFSTVLLLLGSCAATQDRPAAVERMYVIHCGESVASDLSRWTTSADAGKSVLLSDHCYLIRHAKGLMLWDSGYADRFAASMPDGFKAPGSQFTVYVRKPLVQSLQEIGVAPADIQHFAMSHHHADHSGNASLFAGSTLYMQASEHDAIFGAEPQKYNVVSANFERLRGAKTVKLSGDHDVFGDGSVVIKATPGHTPGHQALFVRLPKSAPVVLSGDMVHFRANWDAKRAPAFNFNPEQSVRSMNEMDAFLKATGARLWINHDSEQSKTIPKSPSFIE
jgi:glyoxylase-like metal-dependent hydrolase (beta-lactamase superfamily II)